jgi:hypothetical protein
MVGWVQYSRREARGGSQGGGGQGSQQGTRGGGSEQHRQAGEQSHKNG